MERWSLVEVWLFYHNKDRVRLDSGLGQNMLVYTSLTSLVPRRSRRGQSWTLPWAVTSPGDGQRVKRERLGTRLGLLQTPITLPELKLEAMTRVKNMRRLLSAGKFKRARLAKLGTDGSHQLLVAGKHAKLWCQEREREDRYVNIYWKQSCLSWLEIQKSLHLFKNLSPLNHDFICYPFAKKRLSQHWRREEIVYTDKR